MPEPAPRHNGPTGELCVPAILPMLAVLVLALMLAHGARGWTVAYCQSTLGWNHVVSFDPV